MSKRNTLLEIAERHFSDHGYEELELIKNTDHKFSDQTYTSFERRLILSAHFDIIPPGKFIILNDRTPPIQKMGEIKKLDLMLIDIQVRILEPGMTRLLDMVKTCELFYQSFFDVQVKVVNKNHHQIIDTKNKLILGDYQIKHYPKTGWIVIGNALSEPTFTTVKNLQQ